MPTTGNSRCRGVIAPTAGRSEGPVSFILPFFAFLKLCQIFWNRKSAAFMFRSSTRFHPGAAGCARLWSAAAVPGSRRLGRRCRCWFSSCVSVRHHHASRSLNHVKFRFCFFSTEKVEEQSPTWSTQSFLVSKVMLISKFKILFKDYFIETILNFIQFGNMIKDFQRLD